MTFDEEILRNVWDKGTITRDADPDIWRKDECGAWIRRDFYGNIESQFGWEVDLMVSETEGGRIDPSNLRPLQWRNKIAKHGGRLTCPITASGRSNVHT
jgi:hypothetical protein